MIAFVARGRHFLARRSAAHPVTAITGCPVAQVADGHVFPRDPHPQPGSQAPLEQASFAGPTLGIGPRNIAPPLCLWLARQAVNTRSRNRSPWRSRTSLGCVRCLPDPCRYPKSNLALNIENHNALSPANTMRGHLPADYFMCLITCVNL